MKNGIEYKGQVNMNDYEGVKFVLWFGSEYYSSRKTKENKEENQVHQEETQLIHWTNPIVFLETRERIGSALTHRVDSVHWNQLISNDSRGKEEKSKGERARSPSRASFSSLELQRIQS